MKLFSFFYATILSLSSFAVGATNNEQVTEAIIKYNKVNGINEDYILEELYKAPPIPDPNAKVLLTILKHANAKDGYDAQKLFLTVLSLGKTALKPGQSYLLSALAVTAGIRKGSGTINMDSVISWALAKPDIPKNNAKIIDKIMLSDREGNGLDEKSALLTTFKLETEVHWRNVSLIWGLIFLGNHKNALDENALFDELIAAKAISANKYKILGAINRGAHLGEDKNYKAETAFLSILHHKAPIGDTTTKVLAAIAENAGYNGVHENTLIEKTLAADPIPREKVAALSQLMASAKLNSGLSSQRHFLELLNKP